MPDAMHGERVDVVIRLAKVLEIVLQQFELTLNQFRLLSMVGEGISSSRELGLRLVVKAPNLTVLTRAMAERGLLERAPSQVDGRRIVLTLTASGEALLADAQQWCEHALRNVAGNGNTATGAASLVASLDRWLAPLDEAALRLREVAGADRPYERVDPSARKDRRR
jgi:DNA-binding MarR family transcriptional regulator